jgi:hypothetical protein
MKLKINKAGPGVRYSSLGKVIFTMAPIGFDLMAGEDFISYIFPWEAHWGRGPDEMLLKFLEEKDEENNQKEGDK